MPVSMSCVNLDYNYCFSVQNQIYIQRRNLEREFTENEDINKPFSELHFLNHRLEKLVNQKNNCKYLLNMYHFRDSNNK